MKKIFITSLLIAFFVFVPVARAAEFMQAGKDGQIMVPASENHKNLYVAGGTVSAGGATIGDLTAAGGTIIVGGPVSGELLAAGGTIVIDAPVDGTVRMVGGTLTVNSELGGDVLAAGGTLSLSPSSSVSGDVILAGGSIALDGPVAGMARISGGSVTLNSKINGDVYVTATKSLTLGPSADISGTVFYRGPEPASVNSSAKVGNIEYTKIMSHRGGQGIKALVGLGFLIQMLAVMIAGFALLYLRRKAFAETYEYIGNHFWAALGLGAAGLIVTPLAIALLFLTFIGYYAALIILLGFIAALLLATVMAALFIGNLILHFLDKKTQIHPDWQIVVLGAVVWEVLKFIPIAGWIVLLIVFLVVFGAMTVTIKNGLRRGM